MAAAQEVSRESQDLHSSMDTALAEAQETIANFQRKKEKEHDVLMVKVRAPSQARSPCVLPILGIKTRPAEQDIHETKRLIDARAVHTTAGRTIDRRESCHSIIGVDPLHPQRSLPCPCNFKAVFDGTLGAPSS